MKRGTAMLAPLILAGCVSAPTTHVHYQLVGLQELFTAPWLGTFGAIFTGAAAAYAAFQAVQLAKKEHLRTEKLETRTAKGFCVRTIRQVYHVAIHLRKDGEHAKLRLLAGDASNDPVNELFQQINDDPLRGLKEGHESLLLLPDPLAARLIGQVAKLDLLRSKTMDMFGTRTMNIDPPQPPTWNDVGMAEAKAIADGAIVLGDELRSSAIAMQEFVGENLLPDESEEASYADRLRRRDPMTGRYPT